MELQETKEQFHIRRMLNVELLLTGHSLASLPRDNRSTNVIRKREYNLNVLVVVNSELKFSEKHAKTNSGLHGPT